MRYRYEVDVLGCQFQSPHLQLPRIARETLSKRNAIYIYAQIFEACVDETLENLVVNA